MADYRLYAVNRYPGSGNGFIDSMVHNQADLYQCDGSVLRRDSDCRLVTELRGLAGRPFGASSWNRSSAACHDEYHLDDLPSREARSSHGYDRSSHYVRSCHWPYPCRIDSGFLELALAVLLSSAACLVLDYLRVHLFTERI
ncbi:hypothetical protein D3C85_1323590 [compost metagenome]